MRRMLLFLFLLVGLNLSAYTQLWEPLGGGASWHVKDVYADTIDNLLYAVGDFLYAGDSLCHGVASWDGSTYRSVGTGIVDTACLPHNTANCGVLTSIHRYRDELFVCGGFARALPFNHTGNIARWDGAAWLEAGGPNGNSVRLGSANGELFAAGLFDTISGNAIQQIAKWDGSRWLQFADMGSINFYTFPLVYTAEYYKGEYYFGGNFESPDGHNEIIRWDGSHWETLGTGIHGSNASVHDMEVFMGQLFVVGEFNWGAGNAADNIMAWDGTQWYKPFPNLYARTFLRHLEVIDGSLYIAGSGMYFDTGSELKGPYGLAKYDGVTLSAFGGDSIYVPDVAGLNGEIYISGSVQLFNLPSSDTINFLGHWIGGDSIDASIYQPVRTQDPAAPAPLVTLAPNPAQSQFTLTLPQGSAAADLQIHDVAGRLVVPAQRYRAGEQVDVAALPAGLYFVEVRMRGRVEVLKMVKL